MARTSDTSYEIASPTGVCAATGAPIKSGDPYVAVLLEAAGEERLQRRDYAAAAWEAARVQIRPPLHLLGSWRGVMPRADAPKRRFIDDEALTDLFEQLGEQELDGPKTAFRYVLALILVRKRLLKLEAGKPGVLQVRWPKQGPEQAAMEVADPGMTEQAVAEVIEQLGAVIPDGGA